MLEGVAFAQTWNSTYVKVSVSGHVRLPDVIEPHASSHSRQFTPGKPLDLPTNCEDAGIYRTQSGVFRMLTHCGCTGQYMWSLNGIQWSRTTPEQPWCSNISYTDGTAPHCTLLHPYLLRTLVTTWALTTINLGTTGNLATRQRPKWLTDKSGVATHVFTGVNRPGDGGMGHTWTMAAAVTMPSQ